MKVISGGQTGVDRLGLEIAKKLGLKTGGVAPKGFLTENGSDFSLKDFNLKEHKSSKYPPRTKENISDSDGTVYFASDLSSRGMKLTIKLCQKLNKPYIINPSTIDLENWILENNIKTLNVAGNRGSKLKVNFKNEITQILKNVLSTFHNR